MEWIEKYPNKPWDWGQLGLSRNPSINLEWIEKYPDKDWNWDGLSRNPSITLEWIEKYPDVPWNWRFFKIYIYFNNFRTNAVKTYILL